MMQAEGNFIGNSAFTFRVFTVALGGWLLTDAFVHTASDAVTCFGHEFDYTPFIILSPITPFIIPHG